MAKKATLELEYQPKNIEFYGDYFIVSYNKSNLSDIYQH